ncbi:G protein alpha subunit [Purpureocillium lavendulum]|uniref:G protein alpha subunit n=1 Tax=Purpureocillium lavendulum TaxID=1247861 RepID=A0AB34FHA3_9HYPO|nr:G protein alpha subunit [Purpureocillium lavendulum]
MVKVCNKFHLVKTSQSCESIASDYGISPSDFLGWNPKVKNDCSGLWAEAYACVGVIRTFNFDDGTNNRWTVIDGSYGIKTNALVGDSSKGGKAVLPAPFTNFIYKVQVKLLSENRDAGLIFRTSDFGMGADNYRGYYAGISATEGGFLVLGRADKSWTQLGRVPITIKAHQVYLLKVMALADEISVFVDDLGTPKLTITDGTYRSGVNGVRVYDTGASFDNVEIIPSIYDNFERNMIGWTKYDGSFDARSKQLIASDAFSGKATLDSTFADFIFEGDITLSKTGIGNAGFIFRASNIGTGPDAYNGYYTGIDTGGVLTLGRANGAWKELARFKLDIRAGQKYHVKIQAIGDVIKVYVDDIGTPKITFQDTRYGKGVVGTSMYGDFLQPMAFSYVDKYGIRGP